jgi:hypothetical protein
MSVHVDTRSADDLHHAAHAAAAESQRRPGRWAGVGPDHALDARRRQDDRDE